MPRNALTPALSLRERGILVLLLGLSACTPESDMQGVDPREYYAAHPIKNQVKDAQESHQVTFPAGSNKPDKMDVMRLRNEVSDRSLLSLKDIEISMAPADIKNQARKDALVKMLRYLGWRGKVVRFAASNTVAPNVALMQMTFSEVVLPDCPDWRMSSAHNFSNHESANFGCATETNLGLMVADPNDLVHGTGELPPAHSQRGDLAITQYHTGGAAATQGASAAPAANSGSADPAPVSATPAPQ